MTKLCFTYSTSSPFFFLLPQLFICEFCLKYMKHPKTYARHKGKCEHKHPQVQLGHTIN